MKIKKNIAVLVYGGVELVDMNGPVDVFLKANRLNGGQYNIYTQAATPNLVISEGEVVTITPQYDLTNCPEPDLIVVPGIVIPGAVDPVADDRLIDWIKDKGSKGCTILSVCIGLYTLAKSGLLFGKQATTHYLSIDDVHHKYPDINLVKNVRFVADGNIVSTAGITSGIDGALHLIEQWDGPLVAQQVADIMVYNREAALPPFTILPPYYSQAEQIDITRPTANILTSAN